MRHSIRRGEKKGGDERIVHALLVLIVAFVALYEIAFVIGPSYFGDDTVYLGLANSVLHGGFMENAQVFSVRILNIYPIAFFYLFGVNNLTSAAWAITSFIGSILVAFYLGKEIYSRYAGLLAALLMAFFPLFVVLSETPTPNVPEAFLTGLTMLALILAMRRNSGKWYFAAGALLVASVLTTPLSAIIFGVVLVYLAAEFVRKKFRVDGTTIHLLYGIIAAGALLALFNLANSGNPFITFTVTDSAYSTAGTPAEGILINQDPHYYFQVMFPYGVLQSISNSLANGALNPITLFQGFYAVSSNYVGFYFYAFVAAALYLILARERRAYLPLLWFALAFLYLEFGPIYLSLIPFKYILSHRLERYLTTVSIPLMLIISIALVRFAQSAKGWARGITVPLSSVAAVFLILTAVPINLLWHNIVYYQTYDQQAVANYLNALPSTTRVYLLSGFANLIEYMGYNNMQRFYVYDQIHNCTDIPSGSYVVVPKYQEVFGVPFTPNPLAYCPYWRLVLYPQISGSYSPSLAAAAQAFSAQLFYVPSNSANQTAR
ncbi:MAG: glycosyltransferase family 39 protein [Candidatus Micrarchaeota archaeon]|nr:glycosyltransferase family 39 protein [Candidatus Micrarchaeota archaeon]